MITLGKFIYWSFIFIVGGVTVFGIILGLFNLLFGNGIVEAEDVYLMGMLLFSFCIVWILKRVWRMIPN